MLENKATKLVEKIDIPKLRLWFVWAMLFLLPSIISIISFNYFKEEYLYFYKTDLINSSVEKLKSYNQSIIPENFIENRLDSIKKINTNQSTESLKANIDTILCGESLLCMFFDKDNNNSLTIKSPKAANITSINFLKTSIANLLKASSSNDKNEIKKAQNQLALRMQVFFKTPTPITLSFNKVSLNFSVIHEGELYFSLIKFEKPSKDYSTLFIVMKGKDFSFKKMLGSLHERFPEAKIVFKEIDINKSLEEEMSISVEPSFYSGLKQDKKGIFILAPASLRFIRHVLHGGSAYLNSRFGHLIPFIEFSIPIDEGIEQLKKIEKTINYIALVIIVLSAIYFLHISLFGLNQNWKFKSKIIVLFIISAIFPFSIFTLGIYSIENFNLFISKMSVEHHANVKLQFSSLELENYLTEIETNLKNHVDNLAKCLDKTGLKRDEFSNILSKIEEEIPLSKEIILLNDPIPDDLKPLISSKETNQIIKSIPERLSKELLDDETETILKTIPAKVLEVTNEDEIQNREAQDYIYVANHKISSTEINLSLLNTGELNPLLSREITTWYILLQLHKLKTQKLSGIFCAKFEPKPILSFFLKKYYSRNGFSEIKYNYEINYAFLPIEKSGNAEIWIDYNSISKEDQDICLKDPKTRQFSFKNRTIITKRNQKVPHLAVAIIKELHSFNEKSFIIKTILCIILYLLLIIIFSNKLLEAIIIEPVLLLASNANAIAQGEENWDTEIKSGDEFEELNNNFKNLVSGLQKRNLLKSYVSEDAFSNIAETEEINLKPSGEYLEATIVFSAIKDYDKLTKPITPQESLKLLSNFMSIAEEVTKEFGGSIDKIIGDTIMLVFRNNPTLPSHALRAAKASLMLIEKVKKADLPELYTGIASGKVISGKIGSYSGKLDFTVIGNPVNLAARFKAESKKGTKQTGIIISGITIGLTKGKTKVNFLRRVKIKGKTRQYNIYELVGIREDNLV